MMSKIRYLIVAVLIRVFRILNFSFYYETRYGVKVINRKQCEDKRNAVHKEVYSCYASELYLGVDGLRDEFSMLGTRCDESPHYELMKYCDNGDLAGCSYVEKERKGALDGRDSFVRLDSYHINAFEIRSEELLAGNLAPVKVYVVNGVKYLADGKHRAALLAYNKLPVEYVMVELCGCDLEYMKKLRAIMIRKPEEYTKNLDLINRILNPDVRRCNNWEE